MDEISIDDLQFERYIANAELQESVRSIASAINRDYAEKEIVLVGVLKGSFVFLNDLIKYIEVPHTVDFVRVSSYEGAKSSGQIKLSLDFEKTIQDKHVLIIEDIIDTGNTAKYLMDRAGLFQPKSVSLVTLLYKPDAIKTPLNIVYIGRRIPNDFVVGYGMDYNEKGRGLAHLYRLKN